MEIKFGATVSYFLWSLLLGGVLALLYDFLRTHRRIRRCTNFRIILEDIVFFLFCGMMIFFVAFEKNEGRLRMQGFLGFGMGFGVYRMLCRDYAVRMLVWFYEKTVALTLGLVKVLLFPVRWVFRLFAKPFYVVAWYSGECLRRSRRVLRVKKRRKEMERKGKARQNDHSGRRKRKEEPQKLSLTKKVV